MVHETPKFGSCVQLVAVIFKLIPADFWLLQEVWYQGHLPECACCVATWWERMLRGMLQLTIQLPPRLVGTVFIQLAKFVDVVPIFQEWLWPPTNLLLLSSTSLPLQSALPFIDSSLTTDPLSPLPPFLLIHVLSFTLPSFLAHSPPSPSLFLLCFSPFLPFSSLSPFLFLFFFPSLHI